MQAVFPKIFLIEASLKKIGLIVFEQFFPINKLGFSCYCDWYWFSSFKISFSPPAGSVTERRGLVIFWELFSVMLTLPLFIRSPFIIPEYLQCWGWLQSARQQIYHPFNRIGLPRNWKFNKSRVRMINWLIPSQLSVRLCVGCQEHFVIKLHSLEELNIISFAFAYPDRIVSSSTVS